MDYCWIGAVLIVVERTLSAVGLSSVASSLRLLSAPGEFRSDLFDLLKVENPQAVRRSLSHDAQFLGEPLHRVRVILAAFRAFGWCEHLSFGRG
jgi:hypothetical protein